MLKALREGKKRAVIVWHRRAGKEKTALNWLAWAAHKRVGTYYYIFPTYAQAKKVLWQGIDKHGFRFMDHFPASLIKSKHEQDLRIEFTFGSTLQLIGSDNFDSIMGTNPVGCVFSEYSLQDPQAWDYLRPILAENDGWAVFDYTPRGRNHGYHLYQMAKGNPEWFAEILTVHDTGAITPEAIQAEREAGMSEEMIAQEFYCSFSGIMSGSIFGQQIAKAEDEGRICNVPYDPNIPVDTWWDIGVSDATAIWFTQTVQREVHVIDYYEMSGAGHGIDHYVRVLQQLPYVWGIHHGPHDLDARAFAAGGLSTREVAAKLGVRFNVVPRTDKQSQINVGRAFMNRCYFDRKKTERGRDCLMSYHFKYDDKRHAFQEEPYHDWASHGADAFMYLAVGHKFNAPKKLAEVHYINVQRDDANTGWMAA